MKTRTSHLTQIIAGILCVCLASFIWLPCLHMFFKQNISDYYAETGIAPKTYKIAEHHLSLWTSPELRTEEIRKMRNSNAEWDFMGRTFFALSLSNMALRNPENKDTYLQIMDTIIEETVRIEKEHGIYHFLMGYARNAPFLSKSGRSIFLDGEIALMIAARRLVEEKQEYIPILKERIKIMIDQMKEGPVLCAESYPDECWMFCNSIAIAAIIASDTLDGTDHSRFISDWLHTVKKKLVDKETRLLISSFTRDGCHMDGPEGSSIWMISHCMKLIDPEFAEDQYRRAKKELANKILGFGYAKEWPETWKGPCDIDSGPIIPIVQISAGSSGMAFLGAATFNDQDFLSSLLTSLNYGGFPMEDKNGTRFMASNQVGDAMILYSMVQGPLWKKISAGRN